MADGTPAPLSDAEIAALRDELARTQENAMRQLDRWMRAAESEHARAAALEAENTAMREALRDVLDAAQGSVGLYAPGEHTSVTRARALLAAPPR